MRKTILALMLGVASFATAQTYTFDSFLESNASYSGKYAPVATPAAVCGNTIYQSGLFDQMAMFGQDMLSPIATSAFISSVKAGEESANWAVGISGAARVTAMTTDAEGNVYATGIFADGITFGSRDFSTTELTGSPLAHSMINAFVAKYSAEGNLLAAQMIEPTEYPAMAGDEGYETDASVNPTNIAVAGDKVYVSFTFLGGYKVGDLSVAGNVKFSFMYYDNMCADVVSFDKNLASPAQVLDIRNVDEINTNAYRPHSINIASDGNDLYVGIFTADSTKLAVGAQETTIKFETTEDNTVYGAVMMKLGSEPKVISCTPYFRYYINNIIKTMQYVDGKLYLTGCVATPLPFKDTLVPDLWTDEFAACLDANTFETEWAYITGELRDNMKTTNEKYREVTDAAVINGALHVLGSVNMVADAEGVKVTPNAGTVATGIVAGEGFYATMTSEPSGSSATLTVTPTIDTAISGIASQKSSSSEAFDLNGRSVKNPTKGQVYIQNGKTRIAK